MPKKEPMTDDELASLLGSLRDNMLSAYDDNQTDKRQDNLNAYLGEPDGREVEGYSQYRTREVFEGIEWALPSLLKTFTAGDRIVEYDPVGPEDEDQAAQETDVVNHALLKENNGFLTFYEWFKDALMYPNSYAKVWTEHKTTSTTERYMGLDIQQVGQVFDDPDSEIVEAEEVEGPEPTYNLKVKVTKTAPKLMFAALPPEEVLVDDDLTGVCMDEAQAVCHRVRRTKSYLIEAGYDPDKLEEAGDDDSDYSDERTNREGHYRDDSEQDDSLKTYWVEEWYLQVDYDGDGIAERRKVDKIGSVIFENIEYDYQPIVALSCIPMSHRHEGLSLADVLKPIEELATYFARGINDNIARINRPRKYVSEAGLLDDGSTLDQLLDIDSEYILTRAPGMIEAEQHQPVIQELLAAKQELDAQNKIRTGVSPSLSLDPEVLQKSTMGAFQGALQEASQRIEMIARIFAETGVREVMIKAHRQIKEHQDKPKTLKLRGKWIATNPTDWRDRTNVTVNVGLGFNNKEKQTALRMELLGIQKEALAANLTTPKHIYNTLADLVTDAGLGSPDKYFLNPDEAPPPEPQPDPMAEAAMAQAEDFRAAAQAKLRDAERKDAETRSKLELEAMDLELRAAQVEKTIEEAREKDLANDITEGQKAHYDARQPRAVAVQRTPDGMQGGVIDTDGAVRKRIVMRRDENGTLIAEVLQEPEEVNEQG